MIKFSPTRSPWSYILFASSYLLIPGISAKENPEWNKIQSIVSSCYGEWTQLPLKDSHSNYIPATALLGNGDVGVVSAGDESTKTYLISKSDFWSCGELKGLSHGKTESLTKPLPIGGVTISWSPEEKTKISSFNEKLNILKARLETKITFSGKNSTETANTTPGTELSMESWVCADKNVLITQLISSKALTVEIITWAKSDNPVFPAAMKQRDNQTYVSRSTCNMVQDNPISWTSEAVLATKIIGPPTSCTSKNDQIPDKFSYSVTLSANNPVWVITTIGGGGQIKDHKGEPKEGDPINEAKELLSQVNSPAEVRASQNDHENWWKQYWSASWVELDTRDERLARLNRFYYGAQYILGSSIRKGKIAPGLYGIWQTTDDPMWSSDYHLNYNFIASFYGVASSNRCDLLLPAIEAMMSFEKDGTRRAGSLEELKRINPDYVASRPDLQQGIKDALLYPVGIGPWGVATGDDYWNETMDIAYSSLPLIQHYQYTGDKSILKKTYPFLKKCARFYETWLEKQDDTYVLYAGYNEGSWARNPAVELSAIKNIFSSLIYFSKELDVDKEKRDAWIEIFRKLPDQPTAQWKGKTVYTLAEKAFHAGKWTDIPNPASGHGNIIPLDIVLPGGQLSYYSTPASLEIARNTLETFGNGAWGQMNNYPRIFTDAVRIRHSAEDIISQWDKVTSAQMAHNLCVRDGYHGIEKAGATETLNNMLLLDDRGIIKVFPNWLESADARFSSLRTKGGFLVSAAYEGKTRRIKDLSITSTLGGKLTLSAPWVGKIRVRELSGKKIQYTMGTVGNGWDEKTLTFPTTPGKTYTLSEIR